MIIESQKEYCFYCHKHDGIVVATGACYEQFVCLRSR